MEDIKKRIEFIDLAKGVCIILVVVAHCGVAINIPGWEIVRMPLYFILSGLFFKDYGGWGRFVIQKTNKILIPFFFFYLLGNIAYYLIKTFAPNLLITGSRGICDIFDNRQFFNGPIWFLLCLFWCNVLFCTIQRYIKKDSFRLLLIVVFGGMGWYLGNVVHIFLPLFIDVAFTALPFFAFGYYLKHTSILYPNKFDKSHLVFAISFWLIAFCLTKLTDFRLSLHYNILEGWATYLISFTSVMSILFLCKVVKRVPFVSYVGRYSIILLCTHHLIYRPVKVVFSGIIMNTTWLHVSVAVVTLLLAAALIPVCIRYIPLFTAQKDLIQMPPQDSKSK